MLMWGRQLDTIAAHKLWKLCIIFWFTLIWFDFFSSSNCLYKIKIIIKKQLFQHDVNVYLWNTCIFKYFCWQYSTDIIKPSVPSDTESEPMLNKDILMFIWLFVCFLAAQRHRKISNVLYSSKAFTRQTHIKSQSVKVKVLLFFLCFFLCFVLKVQCRWTRMFYCTCQAMLLRGAFRAHGSERKHITASLSSTCTGVTDMDVLIHEVEDFFFFFIKITQTVTSDWAQSWCHGWRVKCVCVSVWLRSHQIPIWLTASVKSQ